MSAAGIAVVDITPPVGIELFGYHRPEPSKGVLDRLAATALVLEASGTLAVIVNVEHVGMDVPHIDLVRERIAVELNIPKSHVMVLFTHTHSGPSTEDTNELTKAYRQVLQAHLVHVAHEAFSQRRPCKVAWGVTRARIGINRREHTADGQARLGINPHGVVDDRVGLLRIDDAATDVPLGLLVVCTAHANVLKGNSNVISGDFPGWTRRLLHSALACPVIVALGAAGDIDPVWRGSVPDLARMAQTLGGAALTLLPELFPVPISKLWIGSTLLPMHLMELPDPDEAQKLSRIAAQEWGVDTSQWLHKVTKLYHDGIRNLSIDLEVQLLQVNEGILAGIPMEPFAEIALEARRQADSDVAFFGGYTNGLFGYLPTAEEFAFGGYEVEWMPVIYGIDTGYLMPAKPETATQVVEAVARLADRSFHSS